MREGSFRENFAQPILLVNICWQIAGGCEEAVELGNEGFGSSTAEFNQLFGVMSCCTPKVVRQALDSV